MLWSSFPSLAMFFQNPQQRRAESSVWANRTSNITHDANVQQDMILDVLPSFNMEPITIPERKLNGDDNQQQSYLVDSQGNAYEPYSLAWRYLGMYIDCDIEDQTSVNDNSVNDVFRRKLEGNEDDDCSRKVLWAAYVDPRYNGGSIGEYQFFDWRQETWDKSTCQTKRCAKMDCHAKNTHFQLVGVFKETDGLVDWAEQLIKHEGYCVWDESDLEQEGEKQQEENKDNNDKSDYEFMYTRQNYWSSDCKQMYYTDSNGNSLYRDIKPLKDGNITDALYYDADCTQPATMRFYDYIILFYANYYYNEDAGKEVAEKWLAGTNRWNELMTDFTICQPCRAYRKVPNFYSDEGEQHRQRWLGGGDANDGAGDDEQWGYNCQDDAGYQNCNQCYKFEVKTDMEAATIQDLQRASTQGSMLSIIVDGVKYGRGGFGWPDDDPLHVMWIVTIATVFGALIFIVCLYRKFLLKCCHKLRSRQFHKKLREAFLDEPNEKAQKLEKELGQKQTKIEEQQRELDNIQLEMEQQRVIHKMEWLRNKATQNIEWLRDKASRRFRQKFLEAFLYEHEENAEEVEKEVAPKQTKIDENQKYEQESDLDGIHREVKKQHSLKKAEWSLNKVVHKIEWIRNEDGTVEPRDTFVEESTDDDHEPNNAFEDETSENDDTGSSSCSD